MSDYIDLKVVAQVIGTGILLGAGLPLIFSLGVRALSSGTAGGTTGAGSATGFTFTASPAARLAGAACLLVVLVAIAFGIFIITHKS